MPAGDRTGPMGRGPMTGRGAGYCGGYAGPGWASPVSGRGLGLGRNWGGAWGMRGGRGVGWRHRNWYHATGVPGWARFGAGPAWEAPPAGAAPSREQEVEALRQQAEWLKQELNTIGKRMDELEEGAAKSR